MPEHDPTPEGNIERAAKAWVQYKKLMAWMGLATVVTVVAALLYLKIAGVPIALHMVIATIAGVGFTVLLGTGLMGLVYFSNNSGHDEAAGAQGHHDDQP